MEEKKKRVPDGECDDDEEDRESMMVMNRKREEDENCREGMYACLLCLLNKEISLTGYSVFITFLRT